MDIICILFNYYFFYNMLDQEEW